MPGKQDGPTPVPWPERARWSLPYLSGTFALLLLLQLTRGSVLLGALFLGATVGLAFKKAWAPWLTGVLSSLLGLGSFVALLGAIVRYFGPSGEPDDIGAMVRNTVLLLFSLAMLAMVMLSFGRGKSTT